MLLYKTYLEEGKPSHSSFQCLHFLIKMLMFEKVKNILFAKVLTEYLVREWYEV